MEFKKLSNIFEMILYEVDVEKINKAGDRATTYYIQSIKNYVYDDYYCQPLERILFELKLLNQNEYEKLGTAKECVRELNKCLDSLSKEKFEQVLNSYKEDMVYDLIEEIGFDHKDLLEEWIDRYTW